MIGLYEISFISSNSCFFYFSRVNIRKLENDKTNNYSIKIEFGEDLSQFTYSSVNRQSIDIDNHCIGVSSHFAELLGLKEKDKVFVSRCVAQSLTSVNVRPCGDTHYQLIHEQSSFFEANLLNQIDIVRKGQIIPIHVYGNITVRIRIDELNPDLPYGRLEKSTLVIVCQENYVENDNDEVIVLNDVVKLDQENLFSVQQMKNFFNRLFPRNTGPVDFESNPDGNIPLRLKNCFSKLLSQFRIFRETDSGSVDNNVNVDEDELSKILQRKEPLYMYRVRPSFTLEYKVRKKIGNKFIVARTLPITKNAFGPCCFKIMCKISRVDENPVDVIPSANNSEKGRTSQYIYAYVISFNDGKNKDYHNDLYCPDFVVKKLEIMFGSFVQVEQVKWTEEVLRAKCNKNSLDVIPELNIESVFAFTDVQKRLYNGIVQTIIDNIKFRQKINTLILGNSGTGKTYLLNALLDFLEGHLLFSLKIDCSTLKRSKVMHFKKVLSEKLSACCKFQPSVLLLDNLDALVMVREEGNHYISAYSECIGNSVISLCSVIQKTNEVSIVAAATSISDLWNISTPHGPMIFEDIHEIDELQADDRTNILKRLISARSFTSSQLTFLEDIGHKTKGYNVQDLIDLVEIAALKSHMRTNLDNSIPEITKMDLETALTEKVPLSLSGVNLHSNIATSWDDVGGMDKVKKVLYEMFAWPLRYTEIFSCCPLRQQCGVLLYGAPGTGKTLIAGAVANECGLNFISVKGPEIFSKYIGASEEGVRNLFIRAKRARPCMLFFDEFDSLVPRRGGSTSGGVSDRVVNQMLTELDGVEELTGIFILAATSRPDLLDPALLRPGRIDKVVHCDIPTRVERISILKALTKVMQLSRDIDFEKIAERTDGYTGADLHAVLYAAQTALVKEVEKENGTAKNATGIRLAQSHMLIGLSETKPSISKVDRMKYKNIYERFIASRSSGVTNKQSDLLQKVIFA